MMSQALAHILAMQYVTIAECSYEPNECIHLLYVKNTPNTCRQNRFRTILFLWNDTMEMKYTANFPV